MGILYDMLFKDEKDLYRVKTCADCVHSVKDEVSGKLTHNLRSPLCKECICVKAFTNFTPLVDIQKKGRS